MSEYNPNNVFAKIIRGEIPSTKIFEDEQVLAIKDVAPSAPVHVLVIPKKPYVSFDDFVQTAKGNEIEIFFNKVRKVADHLGLVESGYRIIFNHGRDAMQSVPHFHVHILGGKKLGALVGK